MISGAIAALSALIGTALATPPTGKLARRVGAIDWPDKVRRIHVGATPRLGGLAVLAGFILGVAAWSAFVPTGQHWLSSLEGWPGLTALAIATLLIVACGIRDDIRGTRALTKLLVQVLVGVVLFHGGFRFERLSLLVTSVELGWFALPCTVLWFVACINAINLIDGVDGLATGVGLLLATALGIISLLTGQWGAAGCAFALAGALAGFLIYNYHPAVIFLGDTGSMLIGMLLGLVGLMGSLKMSTSVGLLIPLVVLAFPFTDVGLAVARRVWNRLPLVGSDRRHIHHRLLRLGLTQQQAVLALYGLCVVLCGAGLVVAVSQVAWIGLTLAGFALGVVIVFYWVGGWSTTEINGGVRKYFRQRYGLRGARVTLSRLLDRLDGAVTEQDLPELAQTLALGLDCDRVRIQLRSRPGQVVEGVGRTNGNGRPTEGQTEPQFQMVIRLPVGADDEAAVTVQHHGPCPLGLQETARYLDRFATELAARLGQNGLTVSQAANPSGDRPALA